MTQSLKAADGPSQQGRSDNHSGVSPGGSDPIHRHNAHVFVYVLEGSVVMQVKGGKEITLTPGQSFYEDPADVPHPRAAQRGARRALSLRVRASSD